MKPLMNQTITLSLVLSQILNPLAISAAGLEADNSNARYAPSIEMAPNQKVPVVNITAPNSGGLSHNKFLNYNVANEGLILNNSNKTLVNTQLAGYIYGNKNFAGKDTAKVILNEVTSKNRTELRGYTEVAGDKARVIVANPNGVYINGAGFINTSHATITTGTPITNQDTGNLESFRVIGGDIEIDGDGLNVSDLDRASLYSQALILNAKLYANELDVITGDNEITPDGSNYTALVSTEPHAPMSIDSSSLGGIYANKIKLLATKDGIGVNLPIEITASDNLYINADAQITLGTVIASNEVSITSENGSIESNTLYAKTVTLEAKEDITNQNILASSDGITLNSNTLSNNNFIATGVDNNLQKINDSATLVINADTSVAQNGTLFASNDITINTNHFVNDGSIGASGTLFITSSDATITGNLQANAIKTITDNLTIDDAVLYADESLEIQTNADTTITHTTLQATNDDLSLFTDNLTLQNSTLMSADTVSTRVENALSHPLSNNKILAHNISMDMANIDLSLDATNQIEATNDLSVNAKNLTNNTTLVANHDTTITTHNLTNNNLISAGNTLSVNASGNITNNSNVAGGLKGKITNIDTVNLTNKGYITAQDAMTITASNTIKNIAAIGVSGDHGALVLNADTILNYNTLYSSGDMTLRPVTLLKNATDATEVNLGSNLAVIYANDSMNIEGDRGETTVENVSATIQTQTGDMSITAKELVNKRSKDRNDDAFFSYTTSWGQVSFGSSTAYNQQGDLVTGRGINDDNYIGYVDRFGYYLYVDLMYPHSGTFSATSHEKTPYDNPNYRPSLISSGKNFNVNVNQVHNEISTISSAENMIFNNANIENYSNDYSGDITMFMDSANLFYGTVFLNGVRIHTTPGDVGEWTFFYELFNDPSKRLRSTIEAKNILGIATDLQNGITTNPNVAIYRPNMNEADTTLTPSALSGATSQAITYTTPNNPYGMFVPTDPNTDNDYLIEANPAYTNIGNLVNSTYFYEKMGLDTDKLTKRLGDGAYETKLVTDAILNLTGRRMITEGFTTDNAQFVKLMDNAVNVSGILGLEIGKAPSAEQLTNLTEDIVWMEEKVVNGQKVLVPVVYLAKDYSHLKGANIIANNAIDLSVSGNINNNGNILANNLLNLNASSITNNGGVIFSNGTAVLVSRDNVVNTNGGSIKAGEIAIASTNGSVINETSMQVNNVKIGGNDLTYTMVGKTSSIEATKGDLLIAAQKDIQNVGANLGASSNLVLATNEGDINFKALETKTGHNFYSGGGFGKALDTEHLSSSANAGEHIIMQSGGDINLEASKLSAGGTVVLEASENVNLTALNDVHYRDVQTTKKGSFGRSKTTRDMSYKESVVGSEIDAENIVINSGKDTTLQAANLKATENIQVDAVGDINILAQAYREGELHYAKKKGFGGFSSSVSLDQSDALKLREATVKTEAKNIIMNSGKDITVVASEINAAADVQLRAFENLNIIAGEEVKSEKHESQKSSFNPLGLLSLVGIDAGPIYTQDIHNKDNYDTTAKSSTIKAGGSITADTGTTNIVGSNLDASGDVTIKADIGGINVASAQELHNASSLDKKVEVKLTDIFTASADAFTNAHKMDDTKLKINVASATFDESTTSAQSVTNVGSSITSGKNVTLDSSDDIAIKGSDVTAKDTLTLTSKTGNIAITESVDTTNTVSKEKHASAEVNLVAQNEFVETAVAVNNAVKAAEQLKQTKEDYSNYKREVKKLEASLEILKTDPQVSENDIANLQGLISMTKDDEAYYIAAIAAATVNLASKTVAVAQQATAAGASTATAGFSAGLSLDIQGSKTSTDTTATKSNASNLTASNINITTDKTTDTSVTVSGSNVNAADTLNIDTHDLNVIASTDTASSNSSSKDISGSVSMTVYGAASGPQVSLGNGQNESRSNSTTYTNSTLTGNTVNLDATNDATFKGATVRADEALTVNVGNNLEIASVQDTSSSSNHGMNISGGFGMGSDPADTSSNPNESARKVEQGKLNQRVGIRTGDGTVASVNGGIGASNGRSYDTQTVLTSLTGDSVNVTTGSNTKLSGAVIAATDANGNDTGKLNLTTNTLTTENLTDTHYNSATGFSVAANVGLNQSVKDPKPDTQNAEDKTTTTINSPRLAFNTSTDTSVGKTLATVGEGNIAITDTANSTDTTNLNRDVTKVDKELYSSNTGTKVDATLDTRMLDKKGQEEIKQQYNDMDENMKAVSKTLPDANSDNKIEAVAGTIWNNLTGFTGGILPSYANSGGVLGEIPILSGDKDSVHKKLQVVSTNAPRYIEDKDSFIPIEQSDAYKMMSEEQQQKVTGLYISREPIEITKESATYQNGGNGIMNNEGLSVFNVLEQTGMIGQYNNKDTKDKPIETTVFYNPTRGMVGDSLETLVDLFGGTTGIAKQEGEFVRDVTTQRGVEGSNFTLHSQNNALLYSGINYINSSDNTGTKFMPQDYFIKDNGDKSGIPTFVSFGSPVNGGDLRTLIGKDGLNYIYLGAITKPNDWVGEGLGANKAYNGNASLIDRINLINALGLFGNDSPHGSYKCENFAGYGLVCGYRP